MSDNMHKINNHKIVEFGMQISGLVAHHFPQDVKWLETKIDNAITEFMNTVKPKLEDMGIQVVDSVHEKEQKYQGQTTNKQEVHNGMETNKN